METIKQTLFTNWHFMRWLRLGFGVIFMVQAIQMHDMLIGAVAGFFLITSMTNTGCCGARNCSVPSQKNAEDEVQEITYEEVKNT